METTAIDELALEDLGMAVANEDDQGLPLDVVAAVDEIGVDIDQLMRPEAETAAPTAECSDICGVFAKELERGLFRGETELEEMAAVFSRTCAARASQLEAAAEEALRTGFAADVAAARLAGQEAALAHAEAVTWDLVRALYSRRSQRLHNAAFPASPQPEPASPAEVVQRALEEDAALLELHEVVCWLERHAKPAGSKHDVPERPAAGDDGDGDAGDTELVQRCWSLVRAGDTPGAVELCRAARRPWRAASLAGGELWDGARHGNPRRALWRSACRAAAASTSSLPLQERALYGVLGGDLAAALACCESWHDHLWAHLRVLYDIEIDALLSPQQPPSPTPSFHDIFAALHTSVNERVQRESADMFHVCEEHIILDNFAVLLPHLARWCAASSGRRPLPEAYAVRFAAHLVAFFHHDAVRSPQLPEEAARVIAAYAEFLAETGQWEHVALYASLLPPGESVEVYSRLLATTAGPVPPERREMLIRAADSACIPYLSVTTRVAELLAQSAATMTVAKTPTPGLASSTEDVTMMVEAVRWLSFDPSQWLEAVTAANTFTRELLGRRGNIEAAKLVVAALPDRRLGVGQQGQKKKKKTPEEKELAWTRAYIAARDAFARWHEHNSRVPPPPPLRGSVTTRGGFAESLVREKEQQAFEAEQRRWAEEDVQLASVADRAIVTALRKGRPLQARHPTLQTLATELLACLCAVRRAWPPAGSTPCAGLPALITAEPYPLFDSLSDERIKSFLMLFRELALSSLH